ncbi:MAG TPA: dihydrolipoyl dehydrogenase [Alphaproteobacteria bacterium]|nr:dihydrolipoyl dehydrogenase [Alphaproteobacteria bacterium]
MPDTFDLTVIGSGPAGYVAAIRAAQLGMKVCLIEKDKTLGGTCLNVGCIPSKALLESSHKYHEILHGLDNHGIEVAKPKLNLAAMIKRKASVVEQLTKGVAGLMKKNKVTVKTGWATVKKAGVVSVEGEQIATKNILLAVGSTPVELPFARFDHKTIIDSTDALALPEVPKHLIVIGAGVIGLEMGSVWKRLGAKVTLVDVAAKPLAVMDDSIADAALETFTNQGLEFILGAKVTEVKGGKVTIEKDGKAQTLEGDKVLVAVGRKAATANLGLAEAGVTLDARGVVQIDQNYQTNIPGIYAIGDCVPGPMLAHKGEEEGIACVELLAGQHGHVNYGAIPSVVYTHPEAAGVGLTEAEAKAKGDIKIGKFAFRANGRALASGDATGFVKVIADAQTDEMLGVHIFGHNASELIAEATVLMEFKASAEDMARCCHAHPTLAEAVKEAALAVANRAIHF